MLLTLKIGAASIGHTLKSVLSLYCGRPGPPCSLSIVGGRGRLVNYTLPGASLSLAADR